MHKYTKSLQLKSLNFYMLVCDKDAFLPWPDVDMDGLSPKIKNQAHKQGVCSDIQMEIDPTHSESEIQPVQDYRTQKLERTQNKIQRATTLQKRSLLSPVSVCYLSRSLSLFDKLIFECPKVTLV